LAVLAGVGAVEVAGAEVVPLGAVAQHVPSGGEHQHAAHVIEL